MERRTRYYFLSYCVLSISSVLSLQAFDIGSDTTVTRFTTQQVVLNGTRIAKGAELEEGFRLFSITSTGKFDSVFSVFGQTSLNGGKLHLDSDLIFSNVSSLHTLGNIVGNHHTMELSATMTCIPAISPEEVDCGAFLITSVNQPDDITTSDWSFDSNFIAIGLNDSGGSHDILRIYEFDGTTATLKTSTQLDAFQKIELVRWHPSKHWLAVCRERLGSGRKEVLIFSFNTTTGALTELSGLDLPVDVFSVAWHPDGDVLAIGQETDGITIMDEVTTYLVNGSGIISGTPLVGINLALDRTIQRNALDWSISGQYLAVGVDKSMGSPEVFILEFNKITPSLTINASHFFNNAVNAIDWNPVFTDLLAIGLNGSTEKLRLVRHNPGTGTLTELSTVMTDGNPVPRSLDWGQDGFCLAVGWTNGHFHVYTLDLATETLALNTDLSFNGNNVETVRFSPNGQWVDFGQNNNVLYLLRAQAGFKGTFDCALLSDLNIVLNCNLCLQNCCLKFQGQSSINGQGKCLELMPTCTIIVDNNSTLLLKDITIKGINDQRIQCMDHSSTVSLSNVEWILDDDYTFTIGHLEVQKEFTVVGDGHTFHYQSPDQSSIQSCGCMTLEHGVTFKYDPSIANKELLQLADATAKLMLNGATLHTTSTGIQLTKGIVGIDRQSFLMNEGNVEAEGIIFGDGISVANNISLQWYPDAKLEITQGHVIHNDA